jgi:hypothetical protein
VSVMIIAGAVLGLLILYALREKGDVTVSLSAVKRLFEFTIITKERRGPRRP